jgi:CBS domain containing-hemolysin-like protein
MIWLIPVAFVLLLALLTLASYVDRVYAEIGKFLSREFQDNIDTFEAQIEPRLRVSRERASLSMAVVTQLTTAALAVLVAYTVFLDSNWGGPEIAEAAGILIIIIVIFNRLLPFVFFARTRGQWLVRWVWLLRCLIYLVMPVTLALGFAQSVTALTRQHADEQPETQSEAVDALIEAGQEEGILEEQDRQLIQSVVEFGDKTVREVMTPRPQMTAVPADMTVEKFVDVLRTKRFSRVPVYESSVHNIKGVLSAQDVLQVADTEAASRTVGSLMRPDVYFVPETRRSNELLREMQRKHVGMAIVVDEYGGVAGLVTIEDLVEEIVGEIRDDHDAQADIVRENDSAYVVPGSMDVDRLAELFGSKPEAAEAATVAGLVSELAGRIPQNGEVVEGGGLRFEVLESTDRRVERVRIRSMQPSELRLSLKKVEGE